MQNKERTIKFLKIKDFLITMEIKIEYATLQDLEDIQKLNLMLFEKEQKEYDPTFNLEWTFGEKGTKHFKNSIEDKNACALVAKIKDKVVGYLVGCIKKNKNYCRHINKQAKLENMFVLEEYRDRKIGTKLVKEFFKWAKKRDVENICVTASAQNEKAINFYRLYGFKDYDHTLEINF